jgi:membrane protein DedA with SNARE-associated domain
MTFEIYLLIVALFGVCMGAFAGYFIGQRSEYCRAAREEITNQKEQRIYDLIRKVDVIEKHLLKTKD